MTVVEMSVPVEKTRSLPFLKDALQHVHEANGEVVLDLYSVRRLDTDALCLLEEYATIADEKAVKIVLRGVDADIYKVLTLVKLTRRFSFVN